ncbi:amidase domain-containing protein [Clostridium kluyveri]|uniref:Methylase n=1 Tax=Clostridium kluyveri TaxID=1534 RepID=A0A1L5F9Q4_CLOKL|nr:amidase domain-containing protein [Clostridium kluyveri]APM39703.1 methylase [Clostridium kluyveri]UZQ50134.1 amidase domain-containing protein [Clostridium kluyveri]
MNYKNNLSYSRIEAVNYALNYAKSPNPAYKYFPVQGDNGGDCTNFISQCLKAGGAPMVSSHKNQWWYSGPKWSVSWTVAGSLYWYLKINADEQLYGAKGTEVDYVSMLDVGDIIFYKNKRGRIQHSAIITSFDKDYPLISQHTPNHLNISYEKDWAIKMHFLKISL